MSHFLERMASNVTKAAEQASQPALRPLLGSIYAPERAPMGAPAWPRTVGVQSHLVEEERIEASAADRLENAVRSGRRSVPVESNVRAARVESEPSASHHAARALRSEASLQAEVLLPAVNTEAKNTHLATVRPDSAASVRDAAPMHSDRDSVPQLQREEAAAPRDLRTVVDLLMRPSQQEAVPSEGSQPTNGSARIANANAVRHAGQPAREPDEITINIGRIEVTATPQPVARPAAAPSRRSINLDEYLKRGNGRAR
jgi:hypothetical protein